MSMEYATTTASGTADGGDARSLPATLPFAWWNTKLAAVKGKPAAEKQEHLDAVRGVVRTLIGQHGCLLVGLAEVSGHNVLELVPPELRGDWDAVRDTSDQRYPFDVAVIFDRRRLSLMKQEWADGFHAAQRVRAGLVATFLFADQSDWLIVAAAHWRSDMVGAADASDRRMNAASTLKSAIVANLGDVESSAPVLILGDFNAEPFDAPFGSGLPAARSRAEVQRHRPRNPADLLFYNASWRWLGERYPWGDDPPPPTLAGTYRWSGKNVPRAWRTVDQVLVSPSLLGGSSWSLDERMLDVLHDPSVFETVKSRPKAPFDHLPIVGRLQRPALTSTHRVRQS